MLGLAPLALGAAVCAATARSAAGASHRRERLKLCRGPVTSRLMRRPALELADPLWQSTENRPCAALRPSAIRPAIVYKFKKTFLYQVSATLPLTEALALSAFGYYCFRSIWTSPSATSEKKALGLQFWSKSMSNCMPSVTSCCSRPNPASLHSSSHHHF